MCFTLAEVFSQHEASAQGPVLSQMLQRDGFYCGHSCIRCLLWSLAQSWLNPAPKLPLPRIPSRPLTLNMGGHLFILGERTLRVGGVGVCMLLLCLWRQRGKTHKSHLFTCLCMYKDLLRLEEGIEFPRVGVTQCTPAGIQTGFKLRLSLRTAKALAC